MQKQIQFPKAPNIKTELVKVVRKYSLLTCKITKLVVVGQVSTQQKLPFSLRRTTLEFSLSSPPSSSFTDPLFFIVFVQTIYTHIFFSNFSLYTYIHTYIHSSISISTYISLSLSIYIFFYLLLAWDSSSKWSHLLGSCENLHFTRAIQRKKRILKLRRI